MDFKEELTEFPSTVHRNIYCAARQLTLLGRAVAGVTDGALKASCEAYHAFTLEMLSDMYEHPEAYGLPVMELERFLGGKKLNGVRRKHPAQTEKLRSQTYNAVNGYQVLLCTLGREGEAKDGGLLLPPGALEAAGKRASGPSSPIPLTTRLEALARVGLVLDGHRLVSERHSGMFGGMCALAKSSEKMSSFGYFAFQNLEFRNIGAKYKPTYEDYVSPLVGARRAMADEIDASARAFKAKPACNTFWKVDYKYKGAQVMCLENEHGDLGIRITGTYGWDDPALINRRLEGEGFEFRKYILRHIWGCTGCSTTHLGAFATILGQKRRVCMSGGIGFRWWNPTAGDLEVLRKCLAFRCAIIDELKGKG